MVAYDSSMGQGGFANSSGVQVSGALFFSDFGIRGLGRVLLPS